MKVCDALLKECKCNPTLGFYCKDPRKQADQKLELISGMYDRSQQALNSVMEKYERLKQSLAMVDGKKTDEYQSSPLKLRLRNESGTDPVYLKLVRAENGINVVACTEDGSVYADGHLLNIKDDGEVTFYEYISPDFGFVLNESGSLIYNHN
jgi:hypothetical protein